MANYTENLGLFKYDVITDENVPFSITNALNNNWDILDEAISDTGGARNVGEIVASTIPLTDAGLHLLDGAVLSSNGVYLDFVTYIDGLANSYPDLFTTEANWQSAVATYGVCGKFVYTEGNGSGTDYYKWTFVGQQDVYTIRGVPQVGDSIYSKSGNTFTEIGTVSEGNGSEGDGWYRSGSRLLHVVGRVYTYSIDSISYGYNTVRLPKVTGIIEGTDNETNLGNVVEAGLPDVSHTHTRGTMNIKGRFGGVSYDNSDSKSAITGYDNNAFSWGSSTKNGGGDGSDDRWVYFNAADGWSGSTSTNSSVSSIYGNSDTVQPQTVKVLYYIVVATTTKTEIEININQIATDLNYKADVDGSNMVDSVKNFDGQWITTYTRIYNNESMAANTHVVIDLSSILPNDGYVYECLFRMRTSRSDSGGTNNYLCLTLTTDEAPTASSATSIWGLVEADGANFQQSSGICILPIGTERNIRVSNLVVESANNVWLVAYRRIGTNK